MNVFRNEFWKLLSKKTVWILLLLIILNPLALLYIINNPSEDGYTIKEYSNIYKEIEGLNESAALDKIENSLNETDSFGMTSLYNRVYREIKAIFSYEEYLEEIDKKAEDLTIMERFSKNGAYVAENAKKTRDTYLKLKGLMPKPVDPSGIICITDIGVTDYILVFIIFILAVSIVFQEKDHNQFQLLRTMKNGRSGLMISKIMVMIVSIVIMTVILYGTNFVIAGVNFGLPDLNRPIQSLYLYRSSPVNLNVGGLLLSYIMIKIPGNILVGMLFLVICAVFDRIVYVFMIGAGLVFTEVLFYTKIPETHYLTCLKYINIVYGIKTKDMLSDYKNINVLGHPLNTCTIYGIMWVSLFLISVLYIKNYLNISKEKNRINICGSRKISIFGQHTSVFMHESYKVLIAAGALYILILFSGFVLWWNPSMNIRFDSVDEVYYKGYMDELYGPLDSDSYRKLNEEESKFNELSNIIKAYIEQGKSEDYINIKYKEELSKNTAFDKVMSHLSYLESKGGGWFFFDKGFRILTDTDNYENRDISQAFVYIVILIALTCGIYGLDYKNSEISLLQTTVHGRRRLNVVKIVLGLLCTVISFVFIYIIRLINVLNAYGTKGLQAPALSMEHLSAIPQNVSVFQYLLIIMGMRFIAGIIIVLTLFLLTKFFKNSVYAIALCSTIFILPLALVLLNIPGAQYILLNPLLIGNVF